MVDVHVPVVDCIGADDGDGSMMMPVELVSATPLHTLWIDALNAHVACQLGAVVDDGVVNLQDPKCAQV